jgi:VWFA-related protein
MQETGSRLEGVFLSATVTDASGRPVLDLESSDFVILEGGEPVVIERFESPDVPVNVAFVADTSPGAVFGVEWTRRELTKMLAGLAPDHLAEVFEAQTEVVLLVELTSDREELDRAIESLQATGNPTNRIFDATSSALVTLLEGGTARSAVIVLTDGIDVGSNRTEAAFDRVARLAGLPIYVIAIDNVDGFSGNLGASVSGLPFGNTTRARIADLAKQMEVMYYQRQDFWRQLAERSGGELFDTADEDDFSEIYDEIGSRLSGMYSFYYYSDRNSNDSDWVPIEVHVNRPGSQVHAPAGIQFLEDDESN